MWEVHPVRRKIRGRANPLLLLHELPGGIYCHRKTHCLYRTAIGTSGTNRNPLKMRLQQQQAKDKIERKARMAAWLDIQNASKTANPYDPYKKTRAFMIWNAAYADRKNAK